MDAAEISIISQVAAAQFKSNDNTLAVLCYCMSNSTSELHGRHSFTVGAAKQTDYRGNSIETVGKFVELDDRHLPEAQQVGIKLYHTTVLGTIRHELAARRVAEVIGGRVERLVPR